MGLFSKRREHLAEAAELDKKARQHAAKAAQAKKDRDRELNPPWGPDSRDPEAERYLAAEAEASRRVHAANARDARAAAEHHRKRWF